MQSQRCPNCQKRNDVSVYVHGQLAKCSACGIRFTVDRESAQEARAASVSNGPKSAEPPTEVPPAKILTTEEIAFLQMDSQAAPKTAAPGPSENRAQPRPTTVDSPAARASAEPAAPATRPEVPGYFAEALLGKGGMGEVWRARQVSLGRIVAMKLLSPSLAVERDFIRRFERESTALASLAHPNIVQVYDRGSANGHWYFTMEYVEGRSLRDKHADQKLSRPELLKIVAQVARAVDYAHRKGVVHRDLKPENILVDHQNVPKVADFGLAGMSEVGRSSLTMTAVAMGTAHYMAPEQRKDAKNVDGRADLYSLGVMLYELMTGELPVGRFKTPREKVPDLDPRLDAMILRLLEEEPGRRPSRADEVAVLLESLTSGARQDQIVPVPSLQPRPLSSVVRHVRNNPRHKAMLAGAAAVLLTILAVAVFSGPSPSADLWFAARLDRGPNATSVTFGAGKPESILASGGGWELAGGALTRRSTTPAARPSRAYVMPIRLDLTNAVVEADVTVDAVRGMSEAPGAEVVLYVDNDEYVGVRMTIGEDASAQLFHSSPRQGVKAVPQEFEPDPRPGRQHHVVLTLVSNRLTATIDGKQVGTTTVNGLAGSKAKAGLGCRVGACRFSNVKLGGSLSDSLPSSPTAQARP